MKRILNLIFIAMVGVSLYVIGFHSDWLVVPPNFLGHASALSDDKCVNDNPKSYCLPDPNRPSYDGFGNEWDYQGNLIYANCPNQHDPISGQDNPECVCTPPSYLVGYDKDTNKAVCNTVTGCPYGDAVPLGPECDRLGQEQGTQEQAQTEQTPTDFIGK